MAASLGHSETTSIPLFERFTPASMRQTAELRRRARLFLASHAFGPFLGQAVTIYLFLIDPAPDWVIGVIAAAIAAFWLFPFALRATGRFTLLALLSVQNIASVVLFGAYHYGGAGSPLLLWLVIVPLLAFLYLGDSPRLRAVVLLGLVLDLAAFYAAYVLGHGFPARVPLEALSGIGVVSVFCVGVYVTVMALYHARILASRSELEREAASHKATAAELRRAMEAAVAASRAKSEFLATMSHELRTPLNAIIGFSQAMESEAFGPLGQDRYREYAHDIAQSGGHLLEVLNDILDIAKAEAGRLEIVEDPVDVRVVVDAACRLMQPRAEKSNLRLTLDIDADLPPLRGDARKLKQALLNLLSNALKFTPPGGWVEVSAAVGPQRGLEIAVRDTGIGIAKEHLPHLTQPFFQADASLARRHEGSGLGLSIVAAIMQRHGGTLRLDSAVGEGTTATLRFPRERLLPVAAPASSLLPAAIASF